MIQVGYFVGSIEAAVRIDELEVNDALGVLIKHLPIKSEQPILPQIDTIGLEAILLQSNPRECMHDAGWPAQYDTLIFTGASEESTLELIDLFHVVVLYLLAFDGHAKDNLVVTLRSELGKVQVNTP